MTDMTRNTRMTAAADPAATFTPKAPNGCKTIGVSPLAMIEDRLWDSRTVVKRIHSTLRRTALLVLFCVTSGSDFAKGADAPPASLPVWPFQIGAGQRPGTYWWCPGSAFTKDDIDYNLQRFRDGGFGFVHMIPIYGARGAEDRDITYLSSQWMEMLNHTVRKAQALGLFVDMTTGTGWCFGGPNLPADAIDAKARYDAKSNTVSLVPAMKVKRPAPGGEGAMINPFSPRSMELYLERFSQAFDASKAATPRAQYHDSFEYQGNWSTELPDEFKARRGYDLREHLAGLFDNNAAGDRDQLARVKCDYRETLAELHLNSIQQWTDWAHQRNMVTRNQAHGAPANLLDVYAACDIPETEMFGAPELPIPGFRRDPAMCRTGDSDPRVCMLASSAAHVAHPPGRQLVSSESCTWLREHWHTSLAQIKLHLDLFFLTGVNQMLFHGSCYSPKDAPWPGWFFYASTKMDWRNSIWRDVRSLTDYAARCQSVLQAGQPANDVLLYWPIHDLWMNPDGMTIPLTVHYNGWMVKQPIGRAAEALLAQGFAFDFISDRMVESLKFADGKLAAPGGTYRALVVPACKHMPEATLKRLADLRAQGATIIFEKAMPADVPGLPDLEKRRAQLAVDRTRLEKSGAIVADDAIAGLTKAGIPRETMVDAGLRFIRRRTNNSHWYFIANHTAKAFDGWLTPGVPLVSATRFDPMTGTSGRLACKAAAEITQVYLQLEAGETAILCADTKTVQGPAWPYMNPSGEPVVLSGEWAVEFIDGGPVLPAPYKMKDLVSWTSAPDVKAQAFAGTARYTLRFRAPQGTADDWLLDLGDVRESARVRLNGKEVGSLIAIPFRTRVGEFLKPGGNTLEIEVTNLSANRIRDLELRKVDWKIMKDANIVNVNYLKLEPDTWPLEPSGLLGPVKLIPQMRYIPGTGR